MSFSMLIHLLLEGWRPSPKDEPLLIQATETQELKGMYYWIMVPSLFDLVATTLAGIGLLWVDASVYQMLRGSLMIFSAMLSIFCLGKRLKPYHWWGIGLCVVAVAMVGLASVEDASSAQGENPTLE